ncbi:2468_t:CDS:2 [Diversispora eburnea]|uniref:2468_t:CDS:1 n=1 Tax=Diversispora eburnea TaxID=1213867 RepID=A0A9N9B0L7_9GLOM|nr:2468_t:CDS:2 [Diversispora eburnea]
MRSHWEFHSETIEMARKVYGFSQSQTFANIFNLLLNKVAETLTVKDITKTILTEAIERFAQLCKQYENWEKLKCFDAAFPWKEVTNVELELRLMENYDVLSKNQEHYENLVKALKRLTSVLEWVVRLEQLFTIIEIFDVLHEKDDWLTKSRRLSEAGNFLEFLKSIAEHDIENLINCIDDFNDERLNQEDTVASLIQKFLANLASINADNPTLVRKITLCSSCNMALQNMYQNISLRGEVTKEKIHNAVKKGTYLFERMSKDERFTVSLTYPSKGSNVKPYSLYDLQDLRGRALLIAKPTSAANKRKDANEEQIAKTQIMDEFVRQIDLFHEICNIGVKLIQVGHFGYRQYKKSVSGGNKMKELAELLKSLKEDLNQ